MRLLVAGGGTGGHLYPGLALAAEFQSRGAEILFVGTAAGIEARAVPKAGFALELVDVAGLKRMGLSKTLLNLGKLPRSLWDARRILQKFKPDVVVGVGGYASGPMVLVARAHGVPTAVLEQNSIPGVTNRLLGKVVHRVYGGFDAAKAYFPIEKFECLGNPLRAQVLHNGGMGAGKGILIVGGSAGARALNEALPAALKVTFEKVAAVPVTHQSGEADLVGTQERYAACGVKAQVQPFIDDMGAAYGHALLCVCRAGATTCAELTAVGKPSVLIPFPFAADDHQTFNARELQDAGASVMLPQANANSERLGGLLAELLADTARLLRMGQLARGLGKPNAAGDIANALWALCDQESHFNAGKAALP